MSRSALDVCAVYNVRRLGKQVAALSIKLQNSTKTSVQIQRIPFFTPQIRHLKAAFERLKEPADVWASNERLRRS